MMMAVIVDTCRWWNGDRGIPERARADDVTGAFKNCLPIETGEGSAEARVGGGRLDDQFTVDVAVDAGNELVDVAREFVVDPGFDMSFEKKRQRDGCNHHGAEKERAGAKEQAEFKGADVHRSPSAMR